MPTALTVWQQPGEPGQLHQRGHKGQYRLMYIDDVAWCYTDLMSEGLKAHVKNGQIVLDEPASLPEGARLRVVQVGVEEADLALEQAIEDGFSDFAKGDFADAQPFARKLASQS